DLAFGVPPLAGRRLDGARDVRYVRHPLRGPSRPPPHPHARGVRRLPAPEGLSAPRARRTPQLPTADPRGNAIFVRCPLSVVRGRAMSYRDRRTTDSGQRTKDKIKMSAPALDEPELETQTDGTQATWTLYFGPQHPATHTTLRLILELDGERIIK